MLPPEDRSRGSLGRRPFPGSSANHRDARRAHTPQTSVVARSAPGAASPLNRPKDSDFDLPGGRKRQRVEIRPLAHARGYRGAGSSRLSRGGPLRSTRWRSRYRRVQRSKDVGIRCVFPRRRPLAHACGYGSAGSSRLSRGGPLRSTRWRSRLPKSPAFKGRWYQVRFSTLMPGPSESVRLPSTMASPSERQSCQVLTLNVVPASSPGEARHGAISRAQPKGSNCAKTRSVAHRNAGSCSWSLYQSLNHVWGAMRRAGGISPEATLVTLTSRDCR